MLLLIPSLLLVGCKSQKEITPEEAKEIVLQIKDNNDYSNFTFKLTNKGEIGKGEDKISVDLSYTFQYTPDAYYSFFKGHQGDTNYDIEMYCAKENEYGEVKYVRYFDTKKNEYIKSIAVSKDNKEYHTAFSELGAYRVNSMVNYYLKVGEYSEKLDESDTMKFYSSKDGELTIKLISNDKNASSNPDETTAKGESTYKYENYRFVSVVGDTTSNYGNKWITNGSVDYETEVKVELPSDWKSLIKLEA